MVSISRPLFTQTVTSRESDGVCHLPNQRPWAAVYGTAARNPKRTAR
ncbi:hypothetical protein GTW62_05345 [Streptomyces sp. SID5614]|nr:hypothetical protein [Streptomyces sp. SID5614]